MTRVVIVGGGITGLAAAYEFHKAGLPATLVEKERLGGVIRTERHGDLLIEGGPDSFIVQKPAAKELCEELGLGDRLIPTKSRKVHVWSEGRLHEMPEGLFLTVPTKVCPFLKSDLISTWGKLRMGLDLILPRGPEVEDESIGSFVRRRLGREALEKLAEPIMAGIHVASADELSLKSTFPRFADLEREHRSLIKALRRIPPSGNLSPFLSLRGGMSELVEKLTSTLTSTTFVTGDVVGLAPGKVRLSDRELDADHVILAIPAPAAKRLWPDAPEVRYVTTSTVSLCYPKFGDLEGTGFVIPRGENRKILACTWTSNKFEGRAPDDRLLLRCFVKGDVADPEKQARDEMRDLLHAPGEPLFSKVFTWKERNPVYEVGHAAKVAAAESKLPPWLHLAGSGFHGPGIPDCIKDGRSVARKILGG
ncbi:MAG TPA: protoporphyrinogen oxidase [Planctomycetota bacterium]|nr:protoporphyrinogen oxidase [Planctomycetota bacterium]